MTRQRQIHFFGCSFTAGDELSDATWFPWKFTEPHTAESYYAKRLTIGYDWKKYQEENRSRAYPALIENSNQGIKTYNHSQNGKSLRHNILDLILLVTSGCEIDMIYFQLPPPGRDMIISKDYIINTMESNLSDLTKSYILSKLSLSAPENQTIQDSLDLCMLSGFLKSKGIPCYILNLGTELGYRLSDIKSAPQYIFDFKFLSIEKWFDIIDLETTVRTLEPSLIGGHLSQSQHQLVADYITDHLKENLVK
jgi:hypothetical protein